MASVSCKRVWLGALAGGIVWILWSGIVNMVILADRYAEAQETGRFLAEGRYGFFLPVYFVSLILAAYVLAWLYAGVRGTFGPGPGTALRVGVLAGFAMGFPLNFSSATWAPISRAFPLWWMAEMWVGAILATLVAGWLYRDE